MTAPANVPGAASPSPEIRAADRQASSGAGLADLSTLLSLAPWLGPDIGPLRNDVLLSLQRTAGNRAVSRLVEDRVLAPPGRQTPTGTPRGPRPVQRQAPPAPAAGGGTSSVTIDGTLLTTYADIDAWYRTRVGKLKDQRADLVSGGVAVPGSLDKAIRDGDQFASSRRTEPGKPIDTGASLEAQIWFDNQFLKGNNDAEAARGRAAEERFKKLADSFEKAAAKLEEDALPTLRDAQRAKFRKEDEEGLLAVADSVATVIDTALILRDGVSQVAKTQREIVSLVNYALMYQGVAAPFNTNTWVMKVGAALETANKGYAALRLVRAGFDAAAAGTTPSAKGHAALKGMATVISAGGTLLGASAGLTVYANLYIGPAVDACVAGLRNIENLISKFLNKQAIEDGRFNDVLWDYEPGGRPVFDFMLQVMRADDSTGVPKPIPATVKSYFVDKEDELSAGVGGADELPTTGLWFWKDLDDKKIAFWIICNKDSLWGMLYGSARPPL